MRIAYHFRDILFPYIYTSVWQSCTETIPLTEPMYIEYPKNDTSYQTPGQFFFGPNFIIAPIVSPGIGKNKLSCQKVWFPDDTWFNWFTSEKIVGRGQLIAAWADINEFPVYARAGVLIPTQQYTQRMASDSLKKVVLYVYPGVEGKTGISQLYQDDGITDDYKRGRFTVTNFEYTREGNIHKIVIYPVKGSYESQITVLDYSIHIPCTAKALSAKVNGQDSIIRYDSLKYINTLELKQVPVKEKIEIEIEAAEIDQNIMLLKAKEKRLLGLSRNKSKYLTGIMNSLKPSEIQDFISFTGGISLFKDGENQFTVVKSTNSSVEPEILINVIDQYGKEEKTFYNEKIKLENGSSRMIKVTGDLKEKLGTTVKRIAVITFRMHGKEYTIQKVLKEVTIGVRNWYIIGPFDFNPVKKISDYRYEPEKEKTFDVTKIYQKNKSDVQLTWRKVASTSDVIDIRQLYDCENSIAYAVTYLYSDKDQPVKLSINSDDGNEIWLNGRKIHSINVMRGLLTVTDIINTELKKGKNTILLKISQGAGGWAFQLKAETPEAIIDTLKE